MPITLFIASLQAQASKTLKPLTFALNCKKLTDIGANIKAKKL